MTHKKPIDIPHDAAIAGASKCLRNAEALLNTADLTASNSNYGLAVALQVLAVEEGAKAIALYVHGASESGFAEILHHVFRDHVHKHTGAILISLLVHYVVSFKQMYEETEAKVRDGAPPEPTRSNAFHSFARTLYIDAHDPNAQINKMLSWYKVANEKKKRGLYVDWIEGDWYAPGDLKIQDYEEGKEYCLYWLSCVDAFLSVPVESARISFREGEKMWQKFLAAK